MIVKEIKIAIIGLGYVGLPVLSLFSKKYKCWGLDVNKQRIQKLLGGIDEKGALSLSMVRDLPEKCRLTNSWSDISSCNFYVITVPTPIDSNRQPDTSSLESACRSLSVIIKRGDIIVFESTVYPGATEELCIPILENGCKMKSNHDFFVGYSPERINIGDDEHGLANTPKIVSAQNEEVLEMICGIYHEVFEAKIVKASSIKTAEAAKMYENVQRDVLIALANQYSEYCKTEGLNIKEVTECASTKWNFSKVYPGLVGGHCISVDPYYLLARAKAKAIELQLIEEARHINESKTVSVARRIIDFANWNFSKVYPGLVGGHCISVDPYYLLARAKAKAIELQLIEEARHINESKTVSVARRIIDFANAFSPNRDSLNVLVLGFSYKKNVGDIRNTKIAELIGILSKSIGRIDCYDPLVVPQEVMKTYGLNIIISQEDISNKDYDIAIIAVKHNCIRDLHYKAKKTIELEDFV